MYLQGSKFQIARGGVDLRHQSGFVFCISVCPSDWWLKWWLQNINIQIFSEQLLYMEHCSRCSRENKDGKKSCSAPGKKSEWGRTRQAWGKSSEDTQTRAGQVPGSKLECAGDSATCEIWPHHVAGDRIIPTCEDKQEGLLKKSLLSSGQPNITGVSTNAMVCKNILSTPALQIGASVDLWSEHLYQVYSWQRKNRSYCGYLSHSALVSPNIYWLWFAGTQNVGETN